MSWEDKTSPRLLPRFIGLYIIINLYKEKIMSKEKFDIKTIANDLRNKLIEKIDNDNCRNVFAETEYNGYVVEVIATADIDYHTETDYDQYNCPCRSYGIVDNIELSVIELTIADADGEEYNNEELIDEIIKLLEK